MTDEERARWLASLARARHQAERSLLRQVRRELFQCAEEVVAQRWGVDFHRNRVELILESAYARAGTDFANIGRAMLKAERRDDGAGFGARVADLIRAQGPLRARQIAEKSQSIITESLAQSAAAGLGPDAAAVALRRALATGQLSVQRARTIARTEIGAAQNAGLLGAAEAHGVSVHKRWAAVEDERTRASHHAADGQIVAQSARFKVGETYLEYPGDPKGPAGEIINCRCTILLEYAP